MKAKTSDNSQIVILKPGQGRHYEMGSMQSVFKADRNETGNRYSISEWWLDAFSKGPGNHSHSEDDLFYVIEGTMFIQVADQWIEAPKGSFILVPGGIEHDFENRSQYRAGLLNFSIPGNFENSMPMIMDWFKNNSIGSTTR